MTRRGACGELSKMRRERRALFAEQVRLEEPDHRRGAVAARGHTVGLHRHEHELPPTDEWRKDAGEPERRIDAVEPQRAFVWLGQRVAGELGGGADPVGDRVGRLRRCCAASLEPSPPVVSRCT